MKPEPVCGTEDAADTGAIVFTGLVICRAASFTVG